MLGMKMQIKQTDKNGELNLWLQPPEESDLPEVAKGFQSLKVNRYTATLFAKIMSDEKEWLEGGRKDKESLIWFLRPEGSEKVIGVTSLHKISLGGSCTSGIVIFDPAWWGKGIASRAHLGRTLFAADYLNRFTIKSQVRTVNDGSRKALEKVGYVITGVDPCSDFREGKFLHNYILTWFHPERISLLYPEGLPQEYAEGVKKAKEALQLAREVVTFE